MQSSGSIDLEELKGRPCYGGLDLAAVEDVTSFCLVFPWDDESIKVLPYLFVSEAAVERRRKQTGGSYDSFVSKGELIVTNGNSTDYATIKRKIF